MTEQNENAQKLTSDEKLAQLCRGFNRNQFRYLSVIHEYSSKAEAAEAIGLKPHTVYQWPKEVDEAAELMNYDGVIVAKEILRQACTKAALIKTAGMDSDDEKVRQDAATEILDRNIGKATQKQEITGKDGDAIKVKAYTVVSPDDWDE